MVSEHLEGAMSPLPPWIRPWKGLPGILVYVAAYNALLQTSQSDA